MIHLPHLLRLGLLLAAGWLAALGAGCSAPAAPQLPKGLGDECVEPLDVIRRAHMHLLSDQRDKTMHEGIRTQEHSLKSCIECHASKDAEGHWVPVDAPGQFCESCHSYTAVSMDCFQCHAAKPEKQPLLMRVEKR